MGELGKSGKLVRVLMSVGDIFIGPIAFIFMTLHDDGFSTMRLVVDIGKTRAGSIVECKPGQTIEEFSQEFISLSDGYKFDTWCMFQWLVVRARPAKDIRPKDYEWWEARLESIDYLISKECVIQGKLETNTSSSYELVQLGEKMVNNFWRKI